MRKLIPIVFALFIVFSGCKKDKDNDSLLGEWTIDNILTKEYLNNVLNDTYTEPGDGVTLNFKSNGDLVFTDPVSGSMDTVPYELLPGSKVNVDGEVYEIRNLTGSSVTLFIKDDYGGGDYDEIYVNLER